MSKKQGAHVAPFSLHAERAINIYGARVNQILA